MTPIKTAVIGVGALGEHHARILSETPRAELVAVVDSKLDRAQEIAQRHGCRAYQDFRDLFGQAEAVCVVVPTVDHATVGAQCLERGIPVLVEKPIAHDLAAADVLIEASERSGAILQVGHSERFNPAVRTINPLVSQPRFYEAHRLGVFVPRSLDIDVVLDLMIHDLDLILHWSQSPIVEIRAVGIPILTPRVDIANARLEFEDGCVANVTASRVSNEKIRKLRFFQPKDYVSIDFQQQDVQMYSLIETEPGPRIQQRHFDIDRQQPLALELDAFLRAVAGESVESERPCSGIEGKAALDLALQLLAQM